jgi:hypothetical protein
MNESTGSAASSTDNDEKSSSNFSEILVKFRNREKHAQKQNEDPKQTSKRVKKQSQVKGATQNDAILRDRHASETVEDRDVHVVEKRSIESARIYPDVHSNDEFDTPNDITNKTNDIDGDVNTKFELKVRATHIVTNDSTFLFKKTTSCDEPNDDEPNDDEPNDDEPNDDEPNDDEPNDDVPNDDVPNDDVPKDDEPNDDEPNDDEPNDDEPNDDVPNDDVPNDDVPKDDEPNKNKSNDDESNEDKSNEDKSNDDEPNDDEPNDDESNEDESNEDKSNDDEPNDDEPNDDEPNDDEPNDDESNDDESNDDESNDDESNDDESQPLVGLYKKKRNGMKPRYLVFAILCSLAIQMLPLFMNREYPLIDTVKNDDTSHRVPISKFEAINSTYKTRSVMQYLFQRRSQNYQEDVRKYRSSTRAYENVYMICSKAKIQNDDIVNADHLWCGCDVFPYLFFVYFENIKSATIETYLYNIREIESPYCENDIENFVSAKDKRGRLPIKIKPKEMNLLDDENIFLNDAIRDALADATLQNTTHRFAFENNTCIALNIEKTIKNAKSCVESFFKYIYYET